MELTIIAEGNGAYLIEAHGSTFSVVPIMPGQRRNYGVWQHPIDDSESLFDLWCTLGIWQTRTTKDASLQEVLRREFARRGFLGEEAYQAAGPHRPVYRW